ncbi:MAG: carboxymuconolactone decarboxylase family protein [Chromatiales bacterium]|jgi:quercetin dioxygenase-like cupin family protein
MLFPGNESAHYSGAYVTFQPGARTAWHLHPAGQHMIVTNGVALTGTRDGRIIEFEEAETVWCPPDIDHWHGATPQAPMTHLVITGSKDDENVIWKEKVSDEQYYGNRQPKQKAAADLDALSAKQQGIIPIAAFTANGDLASLQVAIRAGLDAGLSVNEIKEIQIHLIGDLFGRGILDYQSREIATLSALANIAGVDSQFKAHVGIATHVGLTEAQLTALAAVLNQRVGMQAGQRAEQALQAVLPEGGENS